MAVSLTYNFIATAIETLAAGVPGSSSPKITYAGFNSSQTLNAGTTVPVTKIVTFEPTLSAGALTIDLTALTGANGASVTFSGLKLQFMLFNNGTTTNGVVAAGSNSSVNIAEGASNGYPLFGASNDITIPAGGSFMIYFPDALADVSGTDKTIDLAGTGTDAFECVLIAG